MDLESVYMLGGVVAITAVILLIIDYLFKNKSYEEVVAEQRQQSSALHNLNNQRTKVKDKKLKKATKKLKEKKNSLSKEETDGNANSEENDSQKAESNGYQKHHVEFKEAIVIEEEPAKETKVQPKEVRPILVNKNAPVIEDNKEVLSSNHFDKLHPRIDELELFNANAVKEETKEKKKNKQNVENESPTETKKKSTKQTKEKENVVKITEQVEKLPPAPTQPAEVIPPVKEKKKKKSELNAVQHIADDKYGVHLSHIMPLVRKAEMSRVEVQILIDMLLNKQQDAPVIEDWSEGKGDPVQKLKKQLAEKEKQVQELQETLTGSQARLREIRSEQNNERIQLTQSLREKEEALKHKILELQNFENSMQGIQLQFMQKQEQFNEETKKARKFMEECEALKFQRSQLEMNTQEDKLTLAKLSAELGELQKHRTMENSAFERNLIQNQQLQMQLNSIKDENEKLSMSSMDYMEKIASLENLNSVYSAEYKQLKSEFHLLEETDRNRTNELSSLQLYKDETEQKHINEKKGWELKLKALQHEKHSTTKENEVLKTECLNLRNQCALLESHKNKLSEENKFLEESKTDSSEDKAHYESKIKDLSSELTTLKSKIDDINQKHKAELENAKLQLSKELEDYKIKNNELRQKNWKVMEALNESENKCKSLSQKSPNNLEAIVLTTKREEQDKNKVFIQRLFPEIESFNNITYDQWQEKISKSIHEYITKLSTKQSENEETAKIQALNQSYKKIIDETENILNALQKNTEDKERHWKNEIKIRDELITDLQNKIEVNEKEVHKNVPKIKESNLAMNNCNHTAS